MNIQKLLKEIKEQSLVKVYTFKRLTLIVEHVDGSDFDIKLIMDRDNDYSEIILISKIYNQDDAEEVLNAILDDFHVNNQSGYLWIEEENE